MQESIIEKRVDERIIERIRQTTATVFSDNPFDSTKRLGIHNNKLSLDEFIDNREKVTKEFNTFDINNLQIQFTLDDFKKNQNNPFLANNVGLAYLSNKDFDNAKKYFDHSLELNPNFRAAKLNLANVFKRTGRIQEAIEIYESLLASNKNDKGVLINLGNIYLITSELSKAEKYFSLVWDENENDSDVGNKIAIINLIKGNFNKAISILRHCITMTSNNAAIYNTMGVAFSFANLDKKAIQAFKSSLYLSPSYTLAVLNLAEVQIRNKEVKSALELVESFCDKFDDATALDLLAKLYMNSGNYNRSLIILKKLYQNSLESKQPPNEVSRLLNNIGVAFHRTEDYSNAAKFYLESLKINENNRVVLDNLIDLYFSTNELDQAKKYIEKLREKYPSYNTYWYYKAIYYKEKENFEESVECLNILLKLEKKFTAAYALLSYIYSEFEFKYQEAIKILEDGLIYLPNDDVIINDLAYNYLMNEEINKARKVLEKANNIDDNIFLTATRGLLALKEENVELGRYLYNRAINMTNDIVIKNHIEQKKNIEVARYYLKSGSYSLAMDLLKKVSKSKPTPYTKQAKILLGKVDISE